MSGKRKKKLKQTEIEVKTIMKMTRNYSQLVFMSNRHTPGLMQFLATESRLKLWKMFLFHLKRSFRSQDI